jgi:WD40 repeat protein
MVHNSTVEDIVFSQDGIKLAIAEYKTVWIRDTRTGEALLKLNHDDHVDAIAFSPDGESLATVRNNVVRVWSLPCGREVLRLKHKDRVNDIEFSPDGTKLATCGWDEDKGIARVWNVFSGKEISRISHDRGVESISFSPKGDRLATASLDNTSAIWDFKSSLDLTNLSHTNNTKDYAEEDRVSDVAFSPDGSRVVTASWDTTARIWNATTGREIDRIDVDHTPSSSYWFPDPRIDSLSFSPDGMLLVIGYKGTIRIMDGNTTEILKIKDVGDITNIAFGSDRSKMATVSWGNKAELWNTSTGEMLIRVPLQELPEDKCYFECYDCYDIALSPDDKLIAIGTKEPSPYVISKGIAMILDANTGKILDNITVAEERVSKVAFSPDGARLATGSWDGTVKIWDLSTKREISRMVHGGSIFDLEFGINGTVLATSSGDCTARVWDADTGRELSCVLLEDPVYGISFSPDGSRLATASGSIAKIWQWRPEDLISCACSRLTRNLTINEWSHYLGNEPYMIDEYFSEANRLS